VTAVTATAVASPPPGSRKRWFARHTTPYLLSLAGGAWLLLLFVIPLVSGLIVSLETGNPDTGYTFTWNWGVYSGLFVNSDVPYLTFFLRSLLYGGVATILTIVIGYPLAYFIAFRVSARWRSTLLLLVLVSFLVSFVIVRQPAPNLSPYRAPAVPIRHLRGRPARLHRCGR
jgi:spermidine/putrescine transport system permease protein